MRTIGREIYLIFTVYLMKMIDHEKKLTTLNKMLKRKKTVGKPYAKTR